MAKKTIKIRTPRGSVTIVLDKVVAWRIGLTGEAGDSDWYFRIQTLVPDPIDLYYLSSEQGYLDYQVERLRQAIEDIGPEDVDEEIK
jgi:hypothetical protein